MIFRKKKEKNFDILTEAEVQKKLYGYFKKDEPKDIKDFKEKALVLEKEQVRKDAEDRIKVLREELVSTRGALQVSRHKINQLKNKILSKREKPTFKKISHFGQRKYLKISLILIVAISVGLFVLISRKKMATSLSGTQTVSLNQTKVAGTYKSLYTIQVCVYEREKDAQRLVKELKQEKFDAYIYPAKFRSKIKYRVYVGRFSSEKSALMTLESLKNVFKDSFVRVVK